MPVSEILHDKVHWHLDEIKARIVAKTGRPSDRFHLGKIILQSLKEYPDNEAQVDGSTGEIEKNESILRRSIQCAIALKKLGYKQGDVMILMAPHHLDLAVPFYAALYLGIIVAPTDRFLIGKEITDSFTVTRPKLVFSQAEKVGDLQEAINQLDLDTQVITFDKSDVTDLAKLLGLGDDAEEIENFRAADFDPVETTAMLISTSGTTGVPKSAALTHKNFVVTYPYMWSSRSEIPPYKRVLVVSQLQWLTAILMYIGAPFMGFSRLQSPQPLTTENIYKMINNFRPNFLLTSPTLMMTLMNPETRNSCDFTCFEAVCLGGSAMYMSLIEDFKEASPETKVANAYGISEASGLVLLHQLSSPPTSCGKPCGAMQYRLVDVETGKEIEEPFVNGELWLKGPGLFKGYYRDPKATEETFEGDWFKTGDIFYRDETWNFFFVERLKLLLKFMNHQISPVELETVIRAHPGVLDVAVTGIPDAARGELPVACVVPSPGVTTTAQDIKNLIKESLTDTKQLRGGVIFLKELPLTSTSKVNRSKLKQMALTLERE